MNMIEKRKSQLKYFGALILALGVILAVVGIILIVTSGIGKDLSVAKLIVGIILAILGILGLVFGISFSWISSSLIATKGSVAEENLAKGTVNMNKCKNCGAQVEAGVEICAECEENLKP